MYRMPKIGDKVMCRRRADRERYPPVGKVIDKIAGACGPIVVVEFPGYGVVDLFWKKVRTV